MSTFDLTARRHESGVLGRFIASRPGAAERAGVQALGENMTQTNLTADELLAILGAGNSNAAGVSVTPASAMKVSAVYACVSRICGAIKTLPLQIYERNGADRKPVDHDYYWLFNERANDDMSSADAWTYLMSSKFFHGDGYAELLRPSHTSSRVIGWQPHHPMRVQPFRDTKTGTKYYRVQPVRGEPYVLDQADMVQITSLGYDGLTSPSPITYAAVEAIATAIASQKFSGKLFSEGATFDYALKTDKKLDKDQTDALKASLLARVNGSRAPLILTGGLEPANLSINPKDAEILASRMFSVEEICRIFGVPPHLVGHTQTTSSWGTGMAEQGGNFVRYTLNEHLVQIAQELNHKLWPVRARYFVEHVTAALERGDMKSRFDSYRVGLGRAGEMPWLDIDEIRRMENMPPNADLKQNTGAAYAQPTDPTAG